MKNTKNLSNDNKNIVIKQPNIISCAMYEKGITSTSYKLLRYGWYLLGMLNDPKSSEINNYTVSFSVSDFYNCLGISQGGQNKKIIDRALDELTNAKIKLQDMENDDISYIVMAPTVGYITIPGTKQKVIQMEFNSNLINMMLANMNHFSWIEMLTIGKMKNFYSLRIYELLKSFYNTLGNYGNKKNQWATKFYTVDFLREFFSTQEKYPRESDFILKCIKNPIEEINKACEETQLNFSVECEIRKIGIQKQIRFIGTEKIHSEKLAYNKNDSFELKREKKEIIDDNLEMEKYKKKYAENWNELKQKAIDWEIENTGNTFVRDCHSELLQDMKTLEYIKTQEMQQEFDFGADVN